MDARLEEEKNHAQVEKITSNTLDYLGSGIEFPGFRLTISAGNIKLSNGINVILG